MVYDDQNTNCAQNPNELPLVGQLVRVDPGPLYATVDPTGTYNVPVPAGNWTVTHLIPNSNLYTPVSPTPYSYQVNGVSGGQTVNNLDFAVESQYTCHELTLDIGTPFLRRGHTAVYTVQYCNIGNGTARNASIDITFDPNITPQTASIPWLTPVSNNTYTFLIGDIPPNFCASFYITTQVGLVAIGQTLCVEGVMLPGNFCIPYDTTGWDRSSVNINAGCQNDTAFFTVQNTGSPGNGNMTGPTPYRVYENGILVFTGTLQLCGGCNTVIAWPANGNTIRLEVDQRPGHPGNSQPNETVSGCGGSSSASGGTTNNLPLNGNGNPTDQIQVNICDEVIASWDPNAKSAVPEGVGPQHFIRDRDALSYKINFQNTGNDTAFRVVLRDTLDLNTLDIRTVRSGASSHPYTFRIYGQGILEWTFDPIILPDSNVNEPLSHGFVKFEVEQMPGNLPGTVIENSVAIYFDFNAPVITNQWFNTIEEETVSTDPLTTPELAITAYPNPAGDQVFLRTGDLKGPADLVLVNALGQVVLQRTVRLEPGVDTRVELVDLPQGIYFLEVRSQGRNGRIKLMKK